MSPLRQAAGPRPRIAIAGFALESNRFAPATTGADFAAVLQLEGEPLRRWWFEAGEDACADELDQLLGRDGWQAVPLTIAVAGPGGPCEAVFFAVHLARVVERLDAALSEGPLDALYLVSHGAATTPDDDDPDGTLVTALRDRLGPDIAIVVLNDFHANASPRLLESASLVLGYRQNPHTDILARSRDAARLLVRLLGGWRPQRATQRVPMLVPQVMQLTAPPAPLSPLFAELESVLTDDGIASASIWPGFSLADVPHAALVVHVVGDDAQGVQCAARRLATRAWSLRGALEPRLCAVPDALAAALGHVPGPPLLWADVADNPGGGGRGFNRWLLHALWQAGVDGVLAGLHWAPEVVAQAQAAGVGAEIGLVLDADGEAAGPMIRTRARVLAVHDGHLESTVGMCAGQALRLGATAVLAFEGIRLVCNSLRQQILGSDVFEALGQDPAAARLLVLKSRGHFRAGFAHLVPPHHILEIDAPGLTSPRFERFRFTRLPPGLYPFDRERQWEPA